MYAVGTGRQRVVVEYIKKGRPEIEFHIEEKDNKLTITGQEDLFAGSA